MTFEELVKNIGKSGSKHTDKLLARMNKMEVSPIDENQYLIKVLGGDVYKRREIVIHKMRVNKRELIRTANRLCDKYRVVKQNVTVKNDNEETKTNTKPE